MPDATEFDEVADELYATNPDDFVPARDDAVARAKEAGDKDLARAVGRLRRPTKAAWLANLLARHRAEQLDGLLALAGDLADAQRTLDGATLRALSSQRSRLVAAMSREAGRLAAQAGDSAGESVIRDVSGILEAALADPGVAEEVRAGRLTRTVSYSGFGPEAGSGPVPTRRPPPRPPTPAGDDQQIGDRDAGDGAAAGADDPGRAERERAEHDAQERAERERAERQRLAREREERDRALAEAEAAESRARDRQEADEAARVEAEQDHADARSRVADLAAELDAARERERAAAAAAREAGVTARESARVASAAGTTAARARAHRDELDP
ncbi:MAG: hypothetical protein J0I49_05970 [Pseudonocardia sp.]|uniref:hypothetical protein n=1 Tax=Pseudonocardia sp. TaxID=60912 RepID=UPI001AD5EFE1|nr:hypothetical protein [Pseudonocardia sp.]MBN9097643.1 hypothetical protein [Pseudonocardia sp.]